MAERRDLPRDRRQQIAIEPAVDAAEQLAAELDDDGGDRTQRIASADGRRGVGMVQLSGGGGLRARAAIFVQFLV